MNETIETRSKILAANDLSKSYPGAKGPDDFCFDIFACEILSLAGHHQSGKSTFVKMISGAILNTLYDAGGYKNTKRQIENAIKKGILKIRKIMLQFSKIFDCRVSAQVSAQTTTIPGRRNFAHMISRISTFRSTKGVNLTKLNKKKIEKVRKMPLGPAALGKLNTLYPSFNPGKDTVVVVNTGKGIPNFNSLHNQGRKNEPGIR